MESMVVMSIGSHIAAMLLGAVFMLSGIGKAFDPTAASLYLARIGGLDDPLIARGFGLSEVFLGIWLLLGVRQRWALVVAAHLLAVLLATTLLHVPAASEEECGCFGGPYAAVLPKISPSQRVSIVIVMCAAACWAACGGPRSPEDPLSLRKAV